MTVTTVSVKFVIAVETLPTETTLWMSFESTLVNRTRNIVPMSLVSPQFLVSEKLMLVGKNLLVPCAKITRGREYL